jgi:hypothetical protein
MHDMFRYVVLPKTLILTGAHIPVRKGGCRQFIFLISLHVNLHRHTELHVSYIHVKYECMLY